MNKSTANLKIIPGLLFLLTVIPCLSFSQSFNRGTIEQKTYCDTIPFTLVKNKMIVDVSIRGELRKFLFDTGAPMVISPMLHKEMANEVVSSGQLKDITGKSKTSEMVLLPEFSLGKLTFQQSAAVVQVLDHGMMACFEIDGVVGSNVLRNSVVHIDVANKHLIITNQADHLGLESAYKIRMKLDGQSRPFINLMVGKTKIKALFDSGSDKFVALSGKTYKKLSKKEQVQTIHEGIGSSSSGIYGAAAFDKHYKLQIDNLDLGAATIANGIAIASEDKKKNAAGLALAHYGNITLDFPEKQFYFSPPAASQQFNDQQHFGFTSQYDRDHFRVGVVYANTPAEQQGLKSGHRILKVNEFDLSSAEPQQECAFFLSDMLQLPALTLTFEDDNGEVKTIELKNDEGRL